MPSRALAYIQGFLIIMAFLIVVPSRLVVLAIGHWLRLGFILHNLTSG